MRRPENDEGRPGEERPHNVVSTDFHSVENETRCLRCHAPLTAPLSVRRLLGRGFGSRELLTSLRGRPPVYATKHRAWVTTEATARDLVALAELRDYDVTVLGGGSR